MTAHMSADTDSTRERRGWYAGAFAALRPHQWTKNLLVFAGIVFAAQLNDPVRWAQSISCFFAYCAASSAAYLVNDVRDREADRQHPVKRSRPVASGELSVHAACRLAALLGLIALVFAVPLGSASIALLLGFAGTQVAYTFGLKHVVLVDVMLISTLFVIRAAAGAEAVRVSISPWLLLCTGLLALFLALGKRRGELLLVEQRETPGRRVLDGYSVDAIDQFISVVAASTIVAYALYTFSARDSSALMITIPFVVLGVLRYILLLQRQEAGEEPDRVLLTDVPIVVDMCVWVVTCAVVLVVT